MNTLRKASAQHGFSLLEMLVAIVVFSIGLLGLVMLLTSAIRANHVGMLHSQATFVAESIADRMRANIPGVWLDAYDGTWTPTNPAAAPANLCGSGSPCTPAQVAARDVWAWSRMVGQLLPGGQGTVTCTPQAGRPLPAAAVLVSVPVYTGTCTIALTWNEQTETDAGATPATFTWVVTP